MLHLTINDRPFQIDLPNEGWGALAAFHAHCKKYGKLITAAEIEREIAKRPFYEQVLIARLGYTPVEVGLFNEK